MKPQFNRISFGVSVATTRTVGRAAPSAPSADTLEYAYQYDDIGNRITSTDLGTNRTYTANSLNQYSAITTSDLGLQTSSFEPQFDADGIFAEGYAYDALGRRVATTTREGTTRHAYDEGWQVVADVDGQGNVLASYVWGEGIDRLLAVKIGGESYYPLTDIQGTVWGYVDSQNNIVARWQYDVWGNVVDKEVSVPALATIRYRFQGRECSASTGLVNFRMRWYDSVTGRWLSKDPIGLSGGLNLYAFCGNSPMLYVDPTGTVFMIMIDPEHERFVGGSLNSRAKGHGGKDEKSHMDYCESTALTRRHAPSGNDYEGDPFGHNKKPGTNIPIDPHIHQYPPKGPKRIFNLDSTPRDGGRGVPKCDIPVFKRVLEDMWRIIRGGGGGLFFPAMVIPPEPIRLPDGRLGV